MRSDLLNLILAPAAGSAPDPQQIVNIAIAGAVFALVLSLWFAAMLFWSVRRASRTKKVEQRLGLSQPSAGDSNRVLRLWHDGREATTLVPTAATRNAISARLEKMRREAGWETPMRTILVGLAAVMAMAFVFMLLITSSLLIGIVGSVGVLMVFWVFFGQRVIRRNSAFERQLVDALDLASRSLRAGHPLVGSFQLIATEIPAPVGMLFAEVCQQQNLGMSLADALRDAAAETPSADMKLFATSVIIQLRGGGNLADMMERLAFVIRERMRLARRVRVLTAQTQFSKNTLMALPFIVFVLLNVLNPAYMRPLYTTSSGQFILLLSGCGLALGGFVMNRMSQLKV